MAALHEDMDAVMGLTLHYMEHLKEKIEHAKVDQGEPQPQKGKVEKQGKAEKPKSAAAEQKSTEKPEREEELNDLAKATKAMSLQDSQPEPKKKVVNQTKEEKAEAEEFVARVKRILAAGPYREGKDEGKVEKEEKKAEDHPSKVEKEAKKEEEDEAAVQSEVATQTEEKAGRNRFIEDDPEKGTSSIRNYIFIMFNVA
jgi:hypothetical protein